MNLPIGATMFAGLLLAATTVQADPIEARQITFGQFVTTISRGDFQISGDGFNVQGAADVNAVDCHPCKGGESITFLALSEVRTLSGTVDGVNYPQLFVGNSFFGLPSVFNLMGTASAFIPLDATTGTQVTFPFAASADDRFVGYADRTFTNPVFTLPGTGGGTATVTLHLDGTLSNGTPYFTATQVNWRFDASPSPTPEPASMLLLGTALAGVLITRRARGSGRSSLPGRAQHPLREGDQ